MTIARLFCFLFAGLFALTARAAVVLPDGLVPPPGFAVDEKRSSVWEFDHEPMAYFKPGVRDMEHITPEGKTWRLFLTITPPNKTAEATDALMRAALKAQGWDLLTPSGTLVAHRQGGGHELWFKGNAGQIDYRATLIEVGPPPHSLTLAPPSSSPETFGDQDEFPYFAGFPGATLRKSETRQNQFDVTPTGASEHLLAGPPTAWKIHRMAAGVSPYEYMVVYRDALQTAGWTILRAVSGGDAGVTAHYAKNGRDIYGYAHLLGSEDTVQVADVGAQNEAKKLAEALAREGHVAIYGIYFDVDKSELKPESETALRHILALLTSDAKLKLEVQGHTDNTGNAAHNQTLSESRAASVKRWLFDHGVAEMRLSPRGYAATQPVADNHTPEGRAKNRRVELKKQ